MICRGFSAVGDECNGSMSANKRCFEMTIKRLAIALCMAAVSCPLLGALPEVELIRTDAPIATTAGTIVGGSITSDPIYDSDGDLLRGELEITFSLNASSANSYTVNGVSVAPGASETFVSDFSATGGRLNVPISVDGTGSISTDDYDLSVRVPGLVQWQLKKNGLVDPLFFLFGFFGPDDYIWVGVHSDIDGAQGLGIIKLDIAGNIVDSFTLNSGVARNNYSYEGATPDGNVILSSDEHSVIVAPNGQVVADYPYRILEVLPDGTIYLEAGDTSWRRKLGRLLPSGDYAVTEHPVNAGLSTRQEGSWAVTYTGSSVLREVVSHVDIDGSIKRYDVSGLDDDDADYSVDEHMGSTTNGWLKLWRSFVFVNKDGRAKILKKTDLQAPDSGFTITSQGDWITFFSTYRSSMGDLVKISSDGSSAAAAAINCHESNSAGIFSKGSARDSKLIMNCLNNVVLVNLAAESKFKPWEKFVALEDLTPELVTEGPKHVNFGSGGLGSLPSSGLMNRTDFTFPTILHKP